MCVRTDVLAATALSKKKRGCEPFKIKPCRPLDRMFFTFDKSDTFYFCLSSKMRGIQERDMMTVSCYRSEGSSFSLHFCVELSICVKHYVIVAESLERKSQRNFLILGFVVNLQGRGSLWEGGGSSLSHTFQRKPQVINRLPSKAHMFGAGSCFFLSFGSFWNQRHFRECFCQDIIWISNTKPHVPANCHYT